MQKGEIWRIQFPYGEAPNFKLRPVLIVGASPMGPREQEAVLAAMITSQMHQRRRGDVEIVDYRAAGLTAPSLVKARKLFSASPAMFQRPEAKRLGRVDSATMQAVFREIAVLF